MESIIGLMVLVLKVIFKTAWGMVLVHGKKQIIIQIIMKAITKMIRNLVMGFFNGEAEIYTRVIILMIYGMATEKCTGLMDPIIKECGKEGFNMEKARCAYKIAVLKVVYLKITYSFVIYKLIMIIYLLLK